MLEGQPLFVVRVILEAKCTIYMANLVMQWPCMQLVPSLLCLHPDPVCCVTIELSCVRPPCCRTIAQNALEVAEQREGMSWHIHHAIQ